MTGYFYNPNIHPYQEFKKRLDTFKDYTKEVELPMMIEEEYELENFLSQVIPDIKERCRICYQIRLQKAAEFAKKENFTAFSTTLLVSPYQNHDLIKEMGTAIGEKIGVPFLYYDFREGYRKGVQISKEQNMYRQQYCGCIFSEWDRYKPKVKKIGGIKVNG